MKSSDDQQQQQPKPRQDAAQLIVRHGPRIAWLSALAGGMWILLFPLVTITTGELKTRGTYLEENALLPTLMTSHMDQQQVREASRLYRQGQQAWRRSGQAGYAAWLCETMAAMAGDGLLSCRQHGGLVWGVLGRPGRSEAQEALVLVSYRDDDEEEGDDDRGEVASASGGQEEGELVSGTALLLVLLRELSSSSSASVEASAWRHKNVILLVAPGGARAEQEEERHWAHLPELQAWCEGYMTGRRPFAEPFAGALRAALVLDMPAGRWGVWRPHFRVLTAGSQGQLLLPNLDLTHLTTLFLASSSPSSSALPLVHMDWHAPRLGGLWPPPSSWSSYLGRLQCMLGFMLTLATGASGGHAHFLRRGVDSLTVQAVAPSPPDLAASSSSAAGGSKVVGGVGAALQALTALHKTVRSLNNLETRLHHGFFLYVMPSPSHFVSLSEYIYSLLLLLPLPLLPRALSLTMTAASHARTSPKRLGVLVDGVRLLAVAELAGAAALLAARSVPRWVPALGRHGDQQLAAASWLLLSWAALLGLAVAALRVLAWLAAAREGGPCWRVPAALACYLLLFCELGLAFLNFPLALLLALPALLILLILPHPQLPPALQPRAAACQPEPSTASAMAGQPRARGQRGGWRVVLAGLVLAGLVVGPGLLVLLSPHGMAASDPPRSRLQVLERVLVRYLSRPDDGLCVKWVWCLLVLPLAVLLAEAAARWATTGTATLPANAGQEALHQQEQQQQRQTR